MGVRLMRVLPLTVLEVPKASNAIQSYNHPLHLWNNRTLQPRNEGRDRLLHQQQLQKVLLIPHQHKRQNPLLQIQCSLHRHLTRPLDGPASYRHPHQLTKAVLLSAS
ncbi:hypothetical protein FH972_026781 [Carpinus fangiana]|uniref:Uncharacterized protein n=1 Tax=Carpinus fangiana TaxID=176857 RepID=A0A5N6L503_9ROSI|nr:hypothetical protein FH972_026781 [Carpinus fangiana]